MQDILNGFLYSSLAYIEEKTIRKKYQKKKINIVYKMGSKLLAEIRLTVVNTCDAEY